MDPREYGIGAQILRSLGVSDIRLLANRQPKNVAIKGFGLEIIATTPLNGEDVLSVNNDENEVFLM